MSDLNLNFNYTKLLKPRTPKARQPDSCKQECTYQFKPHTPRSRPPISNYMASIVSECTYVISSKKNCTRNNMSRTSPRSMSSTLKDNSFIQNTDNCDNAQYNGLNDQNPDNIEVTSDDDSDNKLTVLECSSFERHCTTKKVSLIINPKRQQKWDKNETIKKCNKKRYHIYIPFMVIIVSAIYLLLEPIWESSDVKCERSSIQEWDFPVEESDIPTKKETRDLIAKAEELVGKIRKKFYNQKSDIWYDITAGIQDTVWYPTKPIIITLYGNDSSTLHCFANELGQISGIVLGTDDHLTLTPRDFANDVGEVIRNLKPQILKKKAIVVEDLLNINEQAIKAFHNFCDKENPLVCRTIYIITVLVDTYDPLQKGLEFVEKEISKKLMGKIDKDILDALVIRITSGAIIPVLPEPVKNYSR